MKFIKLGKNNHFSPRKIEQIKVLLNKSHLKQKEISRTLNVSTKATSLIRNKLDKSENWSSK